VAGLADELIGDTKDAYRWDRALMETEFLLKFLVSVPGVTDPARIRSRDELVRAAQQAAREAFQAKLDHFSEIEAKIGAVNIGAQALSHVMLTVIDEKWKDHLYDLDQLKAAIHYRQWGQKDPLIEYKREGYDMFVGLMRDVHATFAERWLKLQIEIAPPPPRGGSVSPGSGPGGGLVKGPSPRRPAPMVASKPTVDGLVSGDPAVVAQPASVGAGVAANPYAGVDGAGALGHSPRHGVRGSGRPRGRGRGARSGGGFVAPARRAAVGRPRSRAGGGPRQSRSRGRGARAGAPRGRRT